MRIISGKNKSEGSSRFKVGRPCKWSAGKTKTLRVPVVFFAEVFNFVQRLDERELAKTLILSSHPISTPEEIQRLNELRAEFLQ